VNKSEHAAIEKIIETASKGPSFPPHIRDGNAAQLYAQVWSATWVAGPLQELLAEDNRINDSIIDEAAEEARERLMNGRANNIQEVITQLFMDGYLKHPEQATALHDILDQKR
jgi:hypothetical protein